MHDRLFVYGSLRPGGSNAHMLSELGGVRRRGSVRGRLVKFRSGAAAGYKALILGASGLRVPGDVLESPGLRGFWPVLDEFEGPEYERVSKPVLLDDGSIVDAFLYVLRGAD